MGGELTLVVTGGAGFVGGHLVRRLVGEYPEARVVSVDDYSVGTRANHVDDPRVTYLDASTVDIRKAWADAGLPDPGMVFHLGEYSRIVQSFEDIDVCWESNLHG